MGINRLFHSENDSMVLGNWPGSESARASLLCAVHGENTPSVIFELAPYAILCEERYT